MTNQTGKELKFFQSDGGDVYFNEEFDRFCTDNGIIHKTTIADAPQQNEVAERFNQTINQKLRAILFDSGHPMKFWNEALKISR